MAIPSVRVEEQFVDERSNQVAYRVSIEARDPGGIRIGAIEPRIPRGARLVKVVDTSLVEIDSRRKDLLRDLNSSLRSILWVELENFRKEWVARQREAIKSVFSFSGFLSAYYGMVFSNSSFRKRMDTEFRSISFTIYSTEDAVVAYNQWVARADRFPALKSLFEAKLSQLTSIEQRIGRTEDVGVADVEVDSPFQSTFVVEFSRRWLEVQKYQVGFEVEYVPRSSEVPQGRAKGKVISVSSTARIAPHPLSLSIVAMVSAIIGTSIKILVKNDSRIGQVLGMLDTSQMLIGPAVALVFFNVYEHTSLGRGLKFPVNWRAALLVGAVCGLAHERILEALKALLGAS